MRNRGTFPWACVLTVIACGGEDAPPAADDTDCTPGEARACAGPGGCEGGQICAEDGESFGPCDCSAAMMTAEGGGSGGGDGGGRGGSGASGGSTSSGAAAGASTGGTSAGGGGSPSGGVGGIGGTGGAGGATAGGMGGAGGTAQGGAGQGGSPSGGAGGAPPSSCSGGDSVSTCGNGVTDPGEICYGLPEFVAFADDVDTLYRDIAVADIDGNGSVEVFVLASNGSDLRLHPVSTGAGGIAAATPIPIADDLSTTFVSLTPAHLAVGEVTGDTYLDVVTRHDGGSFAPYETVTPGTSTGSLGTPGTPTLSRDGSFRYGRANNDALDDLFVIEAGVIDVSLAESAGTFAAVSSTSPSSAASTRLALADLTGDGRPEIIGGSGGVTIGLNDGTGVYSFWSRYAVPSATNRPLPADIDGDGLTDIVVGTTAAEVRVMRGNGFGGVIGQSIPHTVENSTVNVVFPADLTNDGCIDLAAFHTGGVFSVLPALSPGVFDTYRTFPGIAGTVEMADLNGDGVMDFVSGSSKGIGVILSDP